MCLLAGRGSFCKQSQSHLKTSEPAAFTTWKYFTSPASSPMHCYSKICHGRFAISYPFNLYCAQIAATCHSLLRSGDSATASEDIDPPGQAALLPHTEPNVSPRFSSSPWDATQQHILLSSYPQACPCKPPANQTLEQDKWLPRSTRVNICHNSVTIFTCIYSMGKEETTSRATH